MHASYQISLHLASLVSEKIFFLEIDQPETKIAYGGHVSGLIGTKLAICIKDLP